MPFIEGTFDDERPIGWAIHVFTLWKWRDSNEMTRILLGSYSEVHESSAAPSSAGCISILLVDPSAQAVLFSSSR